MKSPEANYITLPWSHTAEDILKMLTVDPQSGLSAEDVATRLKSFGLNQIESAKKINVLKIFISQLTSPLVLLLVTAAALSFFFEEWLDGFAIVAVILINTIIGFVMEFQAERSMEALKKLTVIPARVLRVGTTG